MKHFYEGGSALLDVEQRQTFRIQRKLKTFLNSFQCLLLSLSTIYYQFSCNVQKSRASGTTGYAVERDNKERGFVKERLLRIVRRDGRRSAAVLLTIFCVLFSFASVVEGQAQEPRNGGAMGSEEFEKRIEIGLGMTAISAGMRLPDSFWKVKFQVFKDGHVIQEDLSDYKGKPMLLSFWASTCGMCLKNIQNLRTFHDKYNGAFKVLLVNAKKFNDSDSRIERVMLRDSLSHQFASIIKDEFMSSIFPYGPIPHYVWINSKGRVVAITDQKFVTETNVSVLLSND